MSCFSSVQALGPDAFFFFKKFISLKNCFQLYGEMIDIV